MALTIAKKIIICIFIFACSSSSSIYERLEIINKFNSLSAERPIKVFSRQELENIHYPLIEIQTNGILKQSLMLPLSQRDNYFNYSSGSGQLITMNGFVVTKTNGINIDLLSVEVPKESPLLNKMEPRLWPLEGKRKYSFLTHLNQIKNHSFSCIFKLHEKEKISIVEIDYNLIKITENCKGGLNSFENVYWVDNDGFVWKTKQWFRNEVYADISVIKPHL